MSMRLLRSVFAVLILCILAAALPAQEDDDNDDEQNIPIESDWSGRLPSVYSRGDQTFNIALGMTISLFYIDQEKGATGETNMTLGGMGTLSYNYFLSPHIFLGGELGGMFSPTIGKNMYYIIPMGIRGGYQFIYKRFEFPLALMIGMAPQIRLENNYLGLFVKPTASAYFRITPDWSFGLNTGFWWVPQWTSKSDPDHSGNVNIHGFFLEITLGARYHF